MAKIRKSIKIVIATLITLFLIVLCIVCMLLGLLRYKPEKLLEIVWSGQDTYATIKYYCSHHPSTDYWIEYQRIKSAWNSLQKEKVQKIVFCSILGHEDSSPDNWEGREIVEPEKINRTLWLISTAEKGQYVSVVWTGRMKIITDKHKFIIPVEAGDNAVYGLDWKSKELHRQLWQWGFGREYKYNLPTKEQTVAILLYSKGPPISSLVALFGDKKTAEQLMFGTKNKEGQIIFSKHFKGFEPKNLFEGREWLEKIMDTYQIALSEADEEKGQRSYYRGDLDELDGRIGFITRDGFYWKPIGIDQNAVCDDYIKSEQIKAYFDELGLSEEFLAREPNKALQR